MQDLDQMSNEMPSCCTCNRYFVDEGAKIECKHYRINLSRDKTFMRRLCRGTYYGVSDQKKNRTHNFHSAQLNFFT